MTTPNNNPAAGPAPHGDKPVQRRSILTFVAVSVATAAMTYLGFLRWNRRQAGGRAGMMGPRRDAETRTVTAVDGVVELPKADFPRLGETDRPYALTVEGRPARQLLLWRGHDGELVALNQKCTHAGCLVSLHQAGVFCRCHDSVFTNDGKPVEGPATEPLKQHRVETLDDRYRLILA